MRKNNYFMKLKDKYKYAIAPIVTAILLLIVYALKNIYPFGNNTVDYYDMGQQIASFYYHVYDFLHGEKNLFYDPYTALSVNMAMSTSGCSHLSIFNLFFLFIKREMLIESLSFFLLLKMMCMSLFMYFYIHKRFNISLIDEVIMSVTYAFSGYVLLLYLTIQWLDIAALFPLLMYFLHELLSEGKKAGYITILTMSIVASYYLSFMALIYIVLMVGVVVFSDRLFAFIGKKKDKNSIGTSTYAERKYENYHLMTLFISTVISILLSMFILLPQMCQTLISARFNNENEGGLLDMYYGIVSTTKPAYTTRWFVLFGVSFALAIIATGMVKHRKDRKAIFMTVMSLAIVLSEFVVEGVNLFWHFGSYVQYPIRNGFVIIFTIIVLACGYLQKDFVNKEELDEKGINNDTANMSSDLAKKVAYNMIFAAIAAILVLVAVNLYASRTMLTARNVFHITALMMTLTFVAYVVFTVVKDGKFKNIAIYLFATELVFYGFVMIGKPTFTTGYTEDPEQESYYIRVCDELCDKWYLNAQNYSDKNGNLFFSRVKNPDTTLNANYGLVLRRPCLSNWTHLLSPKLQRDASKLGYTVQYTRLLDAGGTVFSDALLGIDEVISVNPQDEALYIENSEATVSPKFSSHNGLNLYSQNLGDVRKYYLYESRYTLPFGLVVSDTSYDFENGDTCDIYNNIYHSICDDSEDISKYILNGVSGIKPDIISYDEAENQTTLDASFGVAGKKALYFFADQVDTDDYNTKIKVNGKSVLVPTIGDYENDLYPAHFNNNAIYLGSYTDEKIDVNIIFNKNICKDFTTNAKPEFEQQVESEFAPRILAIDLDKLGNLIENYDDCVTHRSFDKAKYRFIVGDAKDGQYLLLPISYDEGYKAKIDGKPTDVIPVGGMFMALKLNVGENIITLSFLPKGMKPGIIISIIGAILLIVVVALDKKNSFLSCEYKWLSNIYFVGTIVIMLAMYVVPYTFWLISIFKR